jgi:HD-GYP domain-containing protein (c-di-GMP phosphodiesterase class II)/CheY-like chemotaxis protein
MIEVLLLEDDREVARLLSFALESQLGLSVREIHRTDEGIKLLDELTNMHLVIFGRMPESQDFIGRLVTLPDENAPKLVLATAAGVDNSSLLYHPSILGVVDRKNLVDDILAVLRKDPLYSGQEQASPYCKIPLSLLPRVRPLPSDVFIRLSDEKFVKLFNKGDFFEAADVEKYSKIKKIEYFHVPTECLPDYLQACRKAIDDILNADQPDERAIRNVTYELQETLHSLAGSLGATEEVQRVAQDNMKVVIKSLGALPDFTTVFRRFDQEYGKYVISHSVLLAQVACLMASRVEWMSEGTYQKLVTAALFHDIMVKNHELAKVATLEDAKARLDLLTEETLDDYRLHPTRAAEFVRRLKNTPPDVDVIIAQHHEAPRGGGFPAKITHLHIAPLSALFILAHDFVDYVLLEGNTDADIFKFLELNKPRYDLGNFKKFSRTLAMLDQSLR